jgi:hypothetical protein
LSTPDPPAFSQCIRQIIPTTSRLLAVSLDGENSLLPVT